MLIGYTRMYNSGQMMTFMCSRNCHNNILHFDLTNTIATQCFKKNRTPENFNYNFVKIALISIKIDIHNLHVT